MKRAMAFVAAVVLVAAAGSVEVAGVQAKAKAGGGAGASKTVVTDYPVQIQFRDLKDASGAALDMVTSDGKGAYVDGKDGVRAVMEVTTTVTGGVTTYDSGKLVVQIAGYRGKLVRKVNVNYTNPILESGCQSTLPSVPTGTLNPVLIQVLGRPALLPTGLDFAATIGFHGTTPTDPSGVFRFAADALVNYPGNCSSLIVAQRTTPSSWTFTTDVDPGVPYYKFYRGYHIYDPVTNVGDTAEFGNSASGSAPFYGNYRMPFSMTVSCLSTTACPPTDR